MGGTDLPLLGATKSQVLRTHALRPARTHLPVGIPEMRLSPPHRRNHRHYLHHRNHRHRTYPAPPLPTGNSSIDYHYECAASTDSLMEAIIEMYRGTGVYVSQTSRADLHAVADTLPSPPPSDSVWGSLGAPPDNLRFRALCQASSSLCAQAYSLGRCPLRHRRTHGRSGPGTFTLDLGTPTTLSVNCSGWQVDGR